MRVHHLQHVPFEGMGSMEAYFRTRSWACSATHLYRGEALPAADAFDWLVVMGGPMGVQDESILPWLRGEKEFIRRAVGGGKVVLGICLGAQLIAEVMGARVTRNRHREIGWFPIERSDQAGKTRVGASFPQRMDVFHWHGDTFDIPAGAVSLGSSEACMNQGFVMDERVVGLQFHLETTADSARALIEHCRGDLDGSRFVQTEEEMLADPERFDRINGAMIAVLESLEESHR